MKNKRGLELVTSNSTGYKTRKFRKIPLLVMYITWPSSMILYGAVFKLFQKLHLLTYTSQFMSS